MKKDWKDLEGKGLRVDVGSTSSQAMSDSTPAEVLCFTTDGRIILNGMEFAPQANLIEDAINAEHPYIMEVVNTSNYTDVTPQILLDSTDCAQEDIDAFFESYPFSDILECVIKGRQLYAQIYNRLKLQNTYIRLDVLSHTESKTKFTILFRWYDGSVYNQTSVSYINGNVTLTKSTDVTASYLRQQIDNIKELLQLA